MFLLALLLLGGADAAFDGYVALTTTERSCIVDRDSTDITVCGLRDADRFRVPFLGYEPGDPRGETVRAERERLFARTNDCKELKPFQTGCGSFGLHVIVGGGEGGVRLREPAP